MPGRWPMRSDWQGSGQGTDCRDKEPADRRRLLARRISVAVQDPERSRHVLGVRRRCGARSGLSAQVQPADRCLGRIRLPHGQVVRAQSRCTGQRVVTPVENNSSLTGFQGSGDIVEKLTENAAAPEDAAPYLTSQQSLLDILPVLGYANAQALASQEDYDAIEFCEQHIPLLARVNARYRATGWTSLGNSPSIEALEEHTARTTRGRLRRHDAGRRTRPAADRFRPQPQGVLRQEPLGREQVHRDPVRQRSELDDRQRLVHRGRRRSDIRPERGLLARQLVGDHERRHLPPAAAALGGFRGAGATDAIRLGLSRRWASRRQWPVP